MPTACKLIALVLSCRKSLFHVECLFWHREPSSLESQFYFLQSGKSTPYVLKNISCTIPQRKTTAIAGASGSGKTTLLKLLLKFYEHISGSINIGSIGLIKINNDFWRINCGAVMQDTFIFNETTAGNISESEQNEIIDLEIFFKRTH